MNATISKNGAGPAQDDLLPHNIDAEESLVGSILLDSRYVFSQIVDLNLSSNDFFIQRLGWIFEAALKTHQAGQPVDLVTLSDTLQRQNRLDDIGGPAYLSQLIGLTPTASHGLYYARLVNEAAYRRRRIEAASRVVKLLYNEATDLDSIEAQSQEIWQTSQAGYASPQSQWQIFSLVDAYQPREPVRWAIEGFFALPSLNIVYGSPGTMKSLLVADMLACVAGGLPWLPPLPGQSVKPHQTNQTAGLWLDFDNGQRVTHERFEAFGRALQLSEATPVHYASMPHPWLDSSDYNQVEALIRRIETLGVKFVVIDNLGTVSGGIDENSSQMIAVMSNLRRMADTTGAAVIVIHHQRKSNGFKGRAGDTLRGHSSIEAALDLALLIERKEAADRVSVKSSKTRNVEVIPFEAQFTYEHKPGSYELAEARFFGLEPERDDAFILLQHTILESVKVKPGVSQNQLIQTVREKLPEMGKGKIRTEILSLTDSQRLKAVGGEIGKSLAYYTSEDYVEF